MDDQCFLFRECAVLVVSQYIDDLGLDCLPCTFPVPLFEETLPRQHSDLKKGIYRTCNLKIPRNMQRSENVMGVSRVWNKVCLDSSKVFTSSQMSTPNNS